MVSLEKELNSLRIERQELEQKLSALFVSLSRLSGEIVVEAEGEKKEGMDGEKEVEKAQSSKSR